MSLELKTTGSSLSQCRNHHGSDLEEPDAIAFGHLSFQEREQEELKKKKRAASFSSGP